MYRTSLHVLHMVPFATEKCTHNESITPQDIRRHYYLCARHTHPDSSDVSDSKLSFSSVHDAYQNLMTAASASPSGSLEPKWVLAQIHGSTLRSIDPALAQLVTNIITHLGTVAWNKWFAKDATAKDGTAKDATAKDGTAKDATAKDATTSQQKKSDATEVWTITLTPSLVDIWKGRVYKITINSNGDPLLVPSWNRISMYSDDDPYVRCVPVIPEPDKEEVHLTEFNDVIFTGDRAHELCAQYFRYNRSGKIVRKEPRGSRCLVWRGAGPLRPDEVDEYGDVYVIGEP